MYLILSNPCGKLVMFKPNFSVAVDHVGIDPSCFPQAMMHSTWHQAMPEEFNAFLENISWELVLRTPSMYVVSCKWLHKTTYGSNG